MAAPHIDNPFGAKPDSEGGPSATDVNKNKGGNKDNKNANAKDGKGIGATAEDSPKCAHPYCNEPSDPSDYPIGLPWASGLLKCLPGYCRKHKKEAIDDAMEGADEELEEGEVEGDEGGRKTKKVCRCKEDTSIICTHKPEDKPPYKKYIYADDPTVGQELCFFLRMMMVGDELDRWEEEEQKIEREAAKKRKERKKKRDEKKNKAKKNKATEGQEKGGKKGKKGKSVKMKGKEDESDTKISKEKSKSSQKINEVAPAPTDVEETAPETADEAARVDDEGVGPEPEP